jgi:4'-phosphopantetheinyl transferase EntD
MPLYKKWSINSHAVAAIWKIDEPETFFSGATGITIHIGHEKKRIEYLCGRFLLQLLKPDFPLTHIAPDKEDKPRIPHNKYYFSISHSWPYVAVVIDEKHEAGIDIQTFYPRILKISHKFLSPQEQEVFTNNINLLTLAWSAKEAAFKWNGRKAVPFIEHLPIMNYEYTNENHQVHIYIGNKRFFMLHIEAFEGEDFVCAYVKHHEHWVNE